MEQNAIFLRLEVDTDDLTLVSSEVVGPLATAPVTTLDDTPYLIHASVHGAHVTVRHGQLGQPLQTVLETDNAPLQISDRFQTCLKASKTLGKLSQTFKCYGSITNIISGNGNFR